MTSPNMYFLMFYFFVLNANLISQEIISVNELDILFFMAGMILLVERDIQDVSQVFHTDNSGLIASTDFCNKARHLPLPWSWGLPTGSSLTRVVVMIVMIESEI